MILLNVDPVIIYNDISSPPFCLTLPHAVNNTLIILKTNVLNKKFETPSVKCQFITAVFSNYYYFYPYHILIAEVCNGGCVLTIDKPGSVSVYAKLAYERDPPPHDLGESRISVSGIYDNNHYCLYVVLRRLYKKYRQADVCIIPMI